VDSLMPTAEQERRILVVVKTYPNPSRTYVETVCCAGVDVDSCSWVRLYPIRFRQLADKGFAKYQIIRCRVRKAIQDPRPESYRIDEKTIVPERFVDTSGRWHKRFAIMPPASRSLDDIQAANRSKARISLGMFRPKQVMRLVIEPATPWTEAQRAALKQQRMGLDGPGLEHLRQLEQIPWKFSYEFECDDEHCRGHKLQILDWEIGEAYRQWSRKYPADWEARIRDRFEREFTIEKDLHLVVGTVSTHPHTFVIIGLVYPPRSKMDGLYVQATLDLMGEQRAVAGGGVGLEAEQADPFGGDEGNEPLKLFPDEG
jgi:hypothetical protein